MRLYFQSLHNKWNVKIKNSDNITAKDIKNAFEKIPEKNSFIFGELSSIENCSESFIHLKNKIKMPYNLKVVLQFFYFISDKDENKFFDKNTLRNLKLKNILK